MAPNPTPSAPECSRCYKPAALCVCDRVAPAARTRTEVLILQHPQEPDKTLGTARLTELALENARVSVGLSWASLSHALGREVDPEDWAILYLGSLRKPLTPAQEKKPLVLLDRRGEEYNPRANPPRGIVVLDGTWSQAKTLWWRNPWMLKLNRLILHPVEPSAYGRLRKQPKRGHLATIEAVAEALDALGEDPAVRKKLKSLFRTMLQRARDSGVQDQAEAMAGGAEAGEGAPEGGEGSVGGGGDARPAVRRAGNHRGGRRKKKPANRGGGPLD